MSAQGYAPVFGTPRVFIAGTAPDGLATVDGAPARITVRLYRSVGGGNTPAFEFAGQVRSAADGTYRLNGLRADAKYMVIGHDPTGEHNAVVMDHITPATE